MKFLICIGMEATVSKLNPECPHCGYMFDYRSTDISNEYTCEGSITTYSVTCSSCDFCSGECESKEAAIKEWNRFERKGTFFSRIISAVNNVGCILIVMLMAILVPTHPVGDKVAILVASIFTVMIVFNIIEALYPLLREYKKRAEMRRFEKDISQWRKTINEKE